MIGLGAYLSCFGSHEWPRSGCVAADPRHQGRRDRHLKFARASNGASMNPQELVFRLVAATFLGSVVGLERHRSDKAAGMRTHMLVSLGSALFMIVSIHGFDRLLGKPGITLDPSRIASLVVSGIGFLGAGTILRHNETVFGLTTAASVWAVAAVGLAAGCGLYLAALLATLLMLVILTAMKPLEEWLAHEGVRHTLTLLIEGGMPSILTQVESLIHEAHMKLRGIQIHPGSQPGQTRLTITLRQRDHTRLMPLIEQLRSLPGVTSLDYESGPST
jgi:putative Mg2+ transporter-C (MgtC) family protein